MGANFGEVTDAIGGGVDTGTVDVNLPATTFFSICKAQEPIIQLSCNIILLEDSNDYSFWGKKKKKPALDHL
jgi:hypothetical protein